MRSLSLKIVLAFIVMMGLTPFLLVNYLEHKILRESDRLLEIRVLLTEKIFPRLSEYSAGPLFAEMTKDEAESGRRGNCSHTALWFAMELEKRGYRFRVLDVKSSSVGGAPIAHALVEVMVDGRWVLTDPLNGWIYPDGILEMRDKPSQPINKDWRGRDEFAFLGTESFFRNLVHVEAYEDLAYTGLFKPKGGSWRYMLIGGDEVAPRPVGLDEAYRYLALRTPAGKAADIGIPASIALLEDGLLAVASYLKGWVVDPASGVTAELVKPTGVEKWYPTGFAYDKETKELFVANYLGKDVLVLRRGQAGSSFDLIGRILDPELVGAENVALSRNGKYIAVADFDNNGVLLFDRATLKKIWRVELGRAHGVSFSSDDRTLVAVGLAPPKVERFNLAGESLGSRGTEGWGRDKYLWPTGVAVNPLTEEMWVTDAHSGRVRQLRPDLAEARSLGGNGRGANLFNMPYGIAFDDHGALWVTDTFKSSLVKLSSAGDVVSRLGPELYGVIGCGDQANCEDYRGGRSESPVGTYFNGRFDSRVAFRHDFGVFSPAQSWHTGFNQTAFLSVDKSKMLSLGATSPAFSSSIYYWIQVGTSRTAASSWVVYGSPQVREWVFDDGYLPCFLKVGLNYWVTDYGLETERGSSVSYDSMKADCSTRLSEFRVALSSGADPLGAYARTVLRKGKEQFFEELKTVFVSPEGVQFCKDAAVVSSNSLRAELAKAFLNQAEKRGSLVLPEVWVARILARGVDSGQHFGQPFSCE